MSYGILNWTLGYAGFKRTLILKDFKFKLGGKRYYFPYFQFLFVPNLVVTIVPNFVPLAPKSLSLKKIAKRQEL